MRPYHSSPMTLGKVYEQEANKPMTIRKAIIGLAVFYFRLGVTKVIERFL